MYCPGPNSGVECARIRSKSWAERIYLESDFAKIWTLAAWRTPIIYSNTKHVVFWSDFKLLPEITLKILDSKSIFYILFSSNVKFKFIFSLIFVVRCTFLLNIDCNFFHLFLDFVRNTGWKVNLLVSRYPFYYRWQLFNITWSLIQLISIKNTFLDNEQLRY